VTASASWQHLLGKGVAGKHFAQLYRDEDFLTEAVSHYVGAGLVQGEGVVIIATKRHWDAVARRIERAGVNVREAGWRGQLRLLDANEALGHFTVNGFPDWKEFQDVVGSVINQCRWRYTKVRVFGEFVDILWQAGNRAAAMRVEEFWNHLVNVQGLSLFCGYCMDNLSPESYGQAMESICEQHSHLIPARDYDRFDKAARRAGEEVLGPCLASMLWRLAAVERPATHMPSAQATLLWMQKNMPITGGKLLARLGTLSSDFQAGKH
jgi:hypothetical protein